MRPVVLASARWAMSECPFQSRLSAFHDGELDADTSWRLKAHLSTCLSCRDGLVGINAVSRLLGTVKVRPMSQIGQARLHAAADNAASAIGRKDRLPLAKTLMAIAASILIISGAWLMEVPFASHVGGGPTLSSHVRPEAEWEKLASGGKVAAPQGRDVETGVAFSNWMVKNLKEKTKGS